ncbi:MAG: DUF523 and DUF1722 domain-containing protein [bacterium]|nr:DUF523 and DUF1722 domain-containing protein [bacterium]
MGATPHDEEPRIRVGVSACLLGEEVRYDGGHKRDSFLLDTLGQYVEWVPVCPEVEVGMGVPRETIRLEGLAEAPRVVAPKSGTDHTERMQVWSEKRVNALAGEDLHGYVFKKGSPSCGLMRVRVYPPDTDIPTRDGQGVFARAVVDRFPLLPVEEEGRLNNLGLRESFIERVFVYYRWRKLLADNPTPQGLVDFHSAIQMSLLSHSPPHYRSLGRLVAQAETVLWSELADQYGFTLMAGLAIPSPPGKHYNVIMHLMEFLKDHLTPGDKAELLEVVETYRKGLVPLIVPVTLLKHHLNRNDVPDWVHHQVYLNPYPQELMLRNHA